MFVTYTTKTTQLSLFTFDFFLIILFIFYYYLQNNIPSFPSENKKQSDSTPEPVSKNDNENDKKVNKSSSAKQTKKENKSKSSEKQVKRASESEFVSDTLQTNQADLDEVKEGMKKLGIDSLAKQALETNKNGKKSKRVKLFTN